MNLENNLHERIEFTNRRKRGIIQPRYHCMSLLNPLEDNNSFLGTGGSSPSFRHSDPYKTPSPIKLQNPWEIKDEWSSPVLKPWTSPETHKDFEGNKWGESFGSAEYIKKLETGDMLKVHTPLGIITGAKLNERKISNYDACILDLLPGIIKKNNGGKW